MTDTNDYDAETFRLDLAEYDRRATERARDGENYGDAYRDERAKHQAAVALYNAIHGYSDKKDRAAFAAWRADNAEACDRMLEMLRYGLDLSLFLPKGARIERSVTC